MIVRAYEKADLDAMIQIWNEVVEEGIAFPQEEFLNDQTGAEFFRRRHIPRSRKMKTVM